MDHLDNVALFAAMLTGDAALVRSQLGPTSFEPQRFQAFADRHHLSAYLHIHLAESPAMEAFPTWLLKHFESRYHQQERRNEETLREASLILNRFAAEEQDVLFLKGPFFAHRFFTDLHQRSHWDLDLMIRKTDLQAANRLIQDLGFARRSFTFLSDELMTRFTHTYEYRKRIAEIAGPSLRRVLPLDLHWCFQSHFSFQFEEQAIWLRSVDCVLDGRRYRVLGDEYALVVTLLAIFSDIQLGVLKLKVLLDVYRMLECTERETNWLEFFERRKQEKVFLICLNVLNFFMSLLECRSRFPRLVDCLDGDRALIRQLEDRDVSQLLQRSRYAVPGRRWALGLYEAPRILSLLWSLASIPFRVAAYESRDPAVVSKLRNRRERKFHSSREGSTGSL